MYMYTYYTYIIVVYVASQKRNLAPNWEIDLAPNRETEIQTRSLLAPNREIPSSLLASLDQPKLCPSFSSLANLCPSFPITTQTGPNWYIWYVIEGETNSSPIGFCLGEQFCYFPKLPKLPYPYPTRGQ